MRTPRFSLRALRAVASLSAIGCCLAFSALRPASGDEDEIAEGRDLFTRDWKLNDPLSGRGDGLGPMFNATSCVACHNQGGVGGGGAAQHNAEMLTVVGVNEHTQTASSFGLTTLGGRVLAQIEARVAQERLNRLFPAFRQTGSIVVHRYGTEPEYERVRAELMDPGTGGGQASAAFQPRDPFVVRLKNDGWGRFAIVRSKLYREKKDGSLGDEAFTFQISYRNTPSLFGAGLLGKIDHATIEALRRKQPRGMRGTIAGRFGWRGQTDDLKSFVVGACANELGLQTKGNPQARDPLQPSYVSTDPDMNDVQVAALVAFAASLPAPQALRPADDRHWYRVTEGARLFKAARCDHCHVENVGSVRGIYSDLMTHDMGEKLADPVAVSTVPLPDPDLEGVPSDYRPPQGSAAYYSIAQSLARMWRTPPLWGVRDTAPYMHDGRAATIEEAILMHDGQARFSAHRYRTLRPTDQQRLLTFVKSLGVPYTGKTVEAGSEPAKTPQPRLFAQEADE